MDPRYRKLADVLVHHSCDLQRGEAVLIQASGADEPFLEALVEAVAATGARPVVAQGSGRVGRALIRNLDEDGFRLLGEIERERMEKMDAFIGIRGGNNMSELSDVPAGKMKLYREHVVEPVHMQLRVPKTKWVVLRWPTEGMAQSAGMSTAAFEDFYFDVCTMDYGAMAKATEPLVARMEAADRVHLLGPGDTDLEFSIKDIPVIPCSGARNIPDGECFTAPVKDSVNGVIHFNTPTVYEGVNYENVRLELKDGRIVDYGADSNQERLDEVFGTDEGARYIGEFSLAFNPYITAPMRDILFDEKIAGSLHFTPGQAYEIADNGNRSKIHWDLVLIQRADHGGGEVRFDGETIRKDGLFVPDDLQGLNPEALKG